jgi:hypothetical protein
VANGPSCAVMSPGTSRASSSEADDTTTTSTSANASRRRRNLAKQRCGGRLQ